MSNKINFKEIFQDCDKEIPVVIHANPDPDAMSSAWGVNVILRQSGLKPAGVYYSGEISHPMNKAMTTLLDMSLNRLDDTEFEEGTKIILIDTSNIGPDTNQPSITEDQVEVSVVIDHHKGKNPKTAKVDRRTAGATASIVWEYLKDINYEFNSDEGKLLATALVTGVFTDTQNLMSDSLTDLDFRAYEDLIRIADKQKLASIMNYPLPQYLFDLRQQAFLEENKKVEESTIVSGVGIISGSKRDALPVIADEFVRMPGITTSVVFAIIKEDNHIELSARSNNITLDVGDFLQNCFSTGGGKLGSGGAKILLGFFSLNGNQELNSETWKLAKRLVMSRVFSNLRGE